MSRKAEGNQKSFEGRTLVVIWAPGGQNRPYSAPRDVTGPNRALHHFIRRYSNTVEAKGDGFGMAQ